MNQLPRDHSPVSALVTIATGLAVAVIIGRLRWYRLRTAPPRVPLTSGPSEPLVLFALLLAMFLLGQTAVAIAVYQGLIDLPADPGARDELTLEVTVKLALVKVLSDGLVLLGWAWLEFRRSAVSRPPRWSWGRSALLGLGAVALCWPLTVSTGAVAEVLYRATTDAPPDAIAHETLRQLLAAPPDLWFWTMIIIVVVATPLLEELTYRGLLQQLLRASGALLAEGPPGASRFDLAVQRVGIVMARPWVAIIVTSVIFVFMHVGSAALYALPSLFVLSLGLGWARERTGRLTAPIVMHAIFNAGNLLLALLVEGGARMMR